MDSAFATPPPETAAETGGVVIGDTGGFTVDPFLVEALQNPRQRLTILRMELDVQRFLQSPEQQQFEFQHFPTSYLRLAAHRVANHYGLATSVQDNGADGLILVMKTTESRFPAVRLTEIPVAKQSENRKFEHMKVSIKTRPSKGSGYDDAGELEKKRGRLRSVEERKEEYDRARARIFNGLPGLNGDDDSSSETQVYGRNTSLTRDDDHNQVSKNAYVEVERNYSLRETGPTSRVAILRDREKDRFDPDYDRSRYIRSLPVNQNFGLPAFNVQKMQPQPYYEMGLTGYNQIPSAPASLSFGPPLVSSMMSPYGIPFINQPSRDAMYMQWPNANIMYAHSYEQFVNASLQAQFCQQPLSFDYMQNR
uniref:R3H domain-containing protein 2 n=1 Tax=Noccaea caerulescens TaxID=107243 RepID=A0A1J3JZB2_NOCCA